MQNWIKQWGPFLAGTPKRTMITLAVIAALVLMAKPELGERAMGALLTALMPFIQVAILLAILFLGFRYLFKGSGGGGSGKKKAK